MENATAENSRELILFRDSFGSSIAPLLLDGYSKITLVDIRYIHPDLLGKFVDFRGCDVLFLYSSLVLNPDLLGKFVDFRGCDVLFLYSSLVLNTFSF